MTLSSTRGPTLEALVTTHQGTVRGYLRFLGCPPHLVDDVCQDVFLAVLARPFEQRSPRETAGYLRKVARHLLLKTMRRERQRPLPLDPEVAEATWVAFEADDGGASALLALKRCLEDLEGRPAEVIRLRYEQGLQREAIRARLGLSEGGVKSILVRTRAKLRECMERGRAR